MRLQDSNLRRYRLGVPLHISSNRSRGEIRAAPETCPRFAYVSRTHSFPSVASELDPFVVVSMSREPCCRGRPAEQPDGFEDLSLRVSTTPDIEQERANEMPRELTRCFVSILPLSKWARSRSPFVGRPTPSASPRDTVKCSTTAIAAAHPSMAKAITAFGSPSRIPLGPVTRYVP